MLRWSMRDQNIAVAVDSPNVPVIRNPTIISCAVTHPCDSSHVFFCHHSTMICETGGNSQSGTSRIRTSASHAIIPQHANRIALPHPVIKLRTKLLARIRRSMPRFLSDFRIGLSTTLACDSDSVICFHTVIALARRADIISHFNSTNRG